MSLIFDFLHKLGMGFKCAGGETSDALEDVVSRFGPNEWLGVLVGGVDERLNRPFESDDTCV